MNYTQGINQIYSDAEQQKNRYRQVQQQLNQDQITRFIRVPLIANFISEQVDSQCFSSTKVALEVDIVVGFQKVENLQPTVTLKSSKGELMESLSISDLATSKLVLAEPLRIVDTFYQQQKQSIKAKLGNAELVLVVDSEIPRAIQAESMEFAIVFATLTQFGDLNELFPFCKSFPKFLPYISVKSGSLLLTKENQTATSFPAVCLTIFKAGPPLDTKVATFSTRAGVAFILKDRNLPFQQDLSAQFLIDQLKCGPMSLLDDVEKLPERISVKDVVSKLCCDQSPFGSDVSLELAPKDAMLHALSELWRANKFEKVILSYQKDFEKVKSLLQQENVEIAENLQDQVKMALTQTEDLISKTQSSLQEQLKICSEVHAHGIKTAKMAGCFCAKLSGVSGYGIGLVHAVDAEQFQSRMADYFKGQGVSNAEKLAEVLVISDFGAGAKVVDV